MFQHSRLSQGLVTAKARLAEQGLMIPRLELVSGHMAVNLITDIKNTLEGLHVSQLYCWLDSTVMLHWIRGNGSYKQFVANRVKKIQEHTNITWWYVNTKENPADLGSRAGNWNGEKKEFVVEGSKLFIRQGAVVAKYQDECHAGKQNRRESR